MVSLKQIRGYEEYSRSRSDTRRKFGGEMFFWCGVSKRKFDAEHHAGTARQLGYRYRIQKERAYSPLKERMVTRYHLWLRRG